MTEKLWNLYLQLQTTIPYGDSFANKNYAVTEPNLDFKHFLDTWIKTDTIQHALDMGPGGVQELFLIKRTFPNATVHGLTAHKPEADFIKTHPHGYQAEHGDMHDTPYKNGQFNYIFSSNVLEHSISVFIALMECRRLLTEPGWATFIIPGFAGQEGGIGPYHLFCLDSLVWLELLRKTGFQVLSTDEIKGATMPDYKYNRFVVKTVPLGHPYSLIMANLKAYKKEVLG